MNWHIKPEGTYLLRKDNSELNWNLMCHLVLSDLDRSLDENFSIKDGVWIYRDQKVICFLGPDEKTAKFRSELEQMYMKVGGQND